MSATLAARSIRYEQADGSESVVQVTLGVPIRDPSDPERTWACPYEIEFLGSAKLRAIFGADAMQALVLAIHTLPVELRALERERGGHFLEPTDLGLRSACNTFLEYSTPRSE